MTLKTATVLAALALSAATSVSATSCGEPRRSATDSCSDWQCSRVLYPSVPLVHSDDLKGDNTYDGNGTYFGFGLCVRGLGEGAFCNVNDDCFVKKYTCQNVSTTTVGPNGTTITSWASRCATKGDDTSSWQGYVAVAVSVVGFGTNFVPAKKVRAGNGMLFQLAQCMGVLLVGIAVALGTQKYTLYPMSLVGGLLWTLGNCLCVPIIQLVGLGIGLSVWGTANMLVGWASGRFGIMGVEQEIAPTPWRSYVGVAVAVVAICAFAAVKPSPAKKKEHDDDDVESNVSLLNSVPVGATQIIGKADHIYAVDEEIRRIHEETEKAKSPNARRAVGLLLGLIAGVFFGLNFNPSQALMDHYDERTLEDSSATPNLHYSPDGIEYFFSVSVGIAMTSISLTVLFYAAHNYLPKSVAAKVLPTLLDDMHLLNFGDMFVPGIISGIIWAFAQCGWFIANTNLGLSVSFPLISIGPSIVANLWGIFLFREVEGHRNFLLLALAFGLVGLSCGFTVWAQQS